MAYAARWVDQILVVSEIAMMSHDDVIIQHKVLLTVVYLIIYDATGGWTDTDVQILTGLQCQGRNTT